MPTLTASKPVIPPRIRRANMRSALLFTPMADLVQMHGLLCTSADQYIDIAIIREIILECQSFGVDRLADCQEVPRLLWAGTQWRDRSNNHIYIVRSAMQSEMSGLPVFDIESVDFGDKLIVHIEFLWGKECIVTRKIEARQGE